MNLVIVESPTKAKTIGKYLGSDYKVVASYGHIRDLPSKNGSVQPENNFHMLYEISESSVKQVKIIQQEAKKANAIYLATDPDREGESISWHIVEMLKETNSLKKDATIQRIVFHEITKKAVKEALEHPRDVDQDLVNAQQARRALDYLVGFTISPILWRKMPGSRSAGRVQSVALKLICKREEEIKKFVSQEYWDLWLNFKEKDKIFKAKITQIDDLKLEKFTLNSQDLAKNAEEKIKERNYYVHKLEVKPRQKSPAAPFTTSSLQQEAFRKLNFSAKKTMQIAQKLYEGVEINGQQTGLITYMRTDSVNMSKEAIKDIRDNIINNYGAKYLNEAVREFSAKTKNAQEAHEAIRPTDIKLTPDKIKDFLGELDYRLYDLIWKRAIATQMANAIFETTTAHIQDKDNAIFAKATGSVMKFDGFIKVYLEGRDEEESDESNLPILSDGQDLNLINTESKQHFTEPPARFTEASLIKTLEELGIGRPSTYATIISVLQDREYVKIDAKKFVPEERGILVTIFLENFFSKYVEYDFTAELENKLDDISTGNLEWLKMMNDFWGDFSNLSKEVSNKNINEILEVVKENLGDDIYPKDEDGNPSKNCPKCKDAELSFKLGKYGPFVACNNYPACNYTKQIYTSNSKDEEQASENEDIHITSSPETGENVTLRKGPYGYYLQQGEQQEKIVTGKNGKEKKEVIKPKRFALPANLKPESINPEMALMLLNLPKKIGDHPENMTEIQFNIGKFGPYLIYDKKFYSVPSSIKIDEITLDIALEIINKKDSSSKAAKDALKEFEDEKGTKIYVYQGKYGPYIKYKSRNYKIPENTDIDSLNLELVKQIITKK